MLLYRFKIQCHVIMKCNVLLFVFRLPVVMVEQGNKRILCVGLICVDLVSVCETYPEEDTDQRYPAFVDDSLLSVALLVGFCSYSMY